MFCPYCGAQIINLNQKFCHNCGKEIENQSASRTPKINRGEPQYSPINPSKPVSLYSNVPVSQNVIINESNRPGPLSVKCFVFALVSIGIAIFAFILGGGIFFFTLIFSRRASFFLFIRIVMWIIVLAVQVIGLIFGLQSKKNCKKAGGTEPINTILKLGKVFGIIGIVINSIAIGSSIIILPIFIYLMR